MEQHLRHAEGQVRRGRGDPVPVGHGGGSAAEESGDGTGTEFEVGRGAQVAHAGEGHRTADRHPHVGARVTGGEAGTRRGPQREVTAGGVTARDDAIEVEPVLRA